MKITEKEVRLIEQLGHAYIAAQGPYVQSLVPLFLLGNKYVPEDNIFYVTAEINPMWSSTSNLNKSPLYADHKMYSIGFYTSEYESYVYSSGSFKDIEKTLELKFHTKVGIERKLYETKTSINFYVYSRNITISTEEMLGELSSIAGTCMPRFFPELFGNPLKKEDAKICRMFFDKKWDEINETLSAEIDISSIKRDVLKRELENVYFVDYKEQIADIENIVSANIRRINDLMAHIHELKKANEDYNIKLMGYMNAGNKNDSEFEDFVDYIMSNKSLEVREFYRNTMYFTVFTFLSNFDSSFFDTFLSNNHSEMNCFYDRGWSGRAYTNEEKRCLYKAVFKSRAYKLGMHASYSISRECKLDAVRNFPTDMFDSYETNKNRVPNPHVTEYLCVGGYEQDMEEAHDNRDYFSLLGIAINSAGSVNLGEIVSSKHLARYIFRRPKEDKIFFKDGEWFTTDEVIKKEMEVNE